MNLLQIDLLGEHAQILNAIKDQLMGSLASSQNPLHIHAPTLATPKALGVDLAQSVDTPNSGNVLIKCYAKAQTCGLEWLHHAASRGAKNRTLFLICPTDYAKSDQASLEFWRSLIAQADQVRLPLQLQSLQVIRGWWVNPDTPQQNGSSLSLNASYAFANASKAFRTNSFNVDKAKLANEGDDGTEHFRPLSKSFINFACEKCSDPECEHKLFSSIKDSLKVKDL